jgi:predicted nucleic acid-binding protein
LPCGLRTQLWGDTCRTWRCRGRPGTPPLREGRRTGRGVALEDLHALDLQRHAQEPLLDRVWELRHNLSAYDTVYLALAEVLDTRVLTCDGRLARAPGAARRVELVNPAA